MPKITPTRPGTKGQMTPVELAQAINEKLDRMEEKAARIEALLREIMAGRREVDA